MRTLNHFATPRLSHRNDTTSPPDYTMLKSLFGRSEAGPAKLVTINGELELSKEEFEFYGYVVLPALVCVATVSLGGFRLRCRVQTAV